MGPHVVRTISNKMFAVFMHFESLYLHKNLGRALNLRNGVGDLNTFHEVLDVPQQSDVIYQARGSEAWSPLPAISVNFNQSIQKHSSSCTPDKSSKRLTRPWLSKV